MQKFSTCVVGAGASGIVAAISARRNGRTVVICERMPRIGKKILASGNGRCNLLNEDLSETHYNTDSRPLVKSVLGIFGKDKIKHFFKELGLETYSDEGRVFPVTNQSGTVLKVLEMELRRLSIPVELNFEASAVSGSKDGFILASKSDKKISCRSLILAAGGRSYPALGSDGSLYGLSSHLGHNIIEPVPTAVPVTAKHAACHMLQGQKIFADVKSMIDGEIAGEATGEVLFTKYGFSGTSILDVSRCISLAINRRNKKDVRISIDMVPFADKETLRGEMASRLARGLSGEELIAGILPNKFGAALKYLVETDDPETIAATLKDWRIKVTGTRGWNEAEFTAGGVDTNEVVPTSLESKLKKGLYFAGEILDVDGERGGYNLAWAWASGFVAGMTM